MLIGLKTARMTAQSALMSHPGADYDKASAASRALYRDALSAIDYVSGGRSGGDMLDEERKAFVKRYLDARKRSLKEGPAGPLPEERLEIREAGVRNG